MQKGKQINYESNVNCFKKTEHVKSTLLYGSLENIKNPLFTIVIPTYRRANMLKDAINSVLAQWHVPFFWDILVLDNEPYTGTPNETESLIKSIDNPRILYYRNSENMLPGDNFNRGILLSRGKWVMMLHDDDILFANALHNMSNILNHLDKKTKKPIGAISVKYHQFKYDPDKPDDHWDEIINVQNYYIGQGTNYNVRKLTHLNILFTAHIGGDVPSNGATYNRDAMIDVGGFNEDYGISADLILYYALENKYNVYSTTTPFGFYRWGANTMIKPESTYNVIKSGYDFREYVYNKNILTKIWGRIFRSCQYQRFTLNVINQKNRISDSNLKISDFDEIYCIKPNKHLYALYIIIMRYYEKTKINQSKKIAR